MKQEEFKKVLGQIMHTKPAVIILIIGVILLILPAGAKTEKEKPQEAETYETYRVETERNLKRILSKVKGVGKVEVFITFENYGEAVYAKNGQSEENKEKSAKEFSDSYVLKNDAGGGESPLVVKKETPEVSGVLVVANGAKDPVLKAQIISAVRAVTGVKAHRVEVLEKK